MIDFLRKINKIYKRFQQLKSMELNPLQHLSKYLIDEKHLMFVLISCCLFIISTILITFYEASRLYSRQRNSRYLFNHYENIWLIKRSIDYVSFGFIFEFWVVTAFPLLIAAISYLSFSSSKHKIL